MLTDALKAFFAPQGIYEPCYMFTETHIIAASVAFVLSVSLFLILRKRMSDRSLRNMFRVLALVITVLETIKIVHAFYYGHPTLDEWLPLSYCGLFIFALFFAGFGRGFLGDCGKAFIAYGTPIAGIAFLIFPTTSLMNFPIWHYLSLYSLFFHGCMLMCGLLLLDRTRMTKRLYISYCVFVIFFAVPSVIMNCTLSSNLMNLREPYNIPIKPLHTIYENVPFVYTLLVLIAYMLMPFPTEGTALLCKKCKKKTAG